MSEEFDSCSLIVLEVLRVVSYPEVDLSLSGVAIPRKISIYSLIFRFAGLIPGSC